jgi:8-oxo-dGTP diphosphatase
MIHIATALLFDGEGKFLIYLRDNKPTIPFPNHWDLFGGHVEQGESPLQALYRELNEELRVTPLTVEFFKDYHVSGGDAQPNIKHVFIVRIAESAQMLQLYEGQELRAIAIGEHIQYRFANILGNIISEYATTINGSALT